MSTDKGNLAEQIASDYLQAEGYKIIERNWRNRFCEIDIIARKTKTTLFIEVKYRKNERFGTGEEDLTDKKLKQMKFAAEYYSTQNHVEHPMLAAIEVQGSEYKVTNFIEITT